MPSLAERIAQVRGERGLAWCILPADQSVYPHPGRVRLPGAVAMGVGEHDLPDVVPEVDHTTDVRRGKLRLYEARGFPEVWVEISNYRAASRPKRRRAGLTIHAREDGVYRGSPESRAFPGWSADELHVSFNERVRSARTCEVPERVGRVPGAREGAGPDDDPMLRSLRVRSREEGLEQGRAVTLAKMAHRMLCSRDVEVSDGFPADPVFAASSVDAVFEAASAGKDEAGFLAALRPPRIPGGIVEVDRREPVGGRRRPMNGAVPK